MDISKLQHVESAAALGERGSTTASPAVWLGSVDRVEINESEHLNALVAKGVVAAAGGHSVRLQALAEAVRAGAFRPVAADVAEQILAQAALENHLADYFR